MGKLGAELKMHANHGTIYIPKAPLSTDLESTSWLPSDTTPYSAPTPATISATSSPGAEPESLESLFKLSQKSSPFFPLTKIPHIFPSPHKSPQPNQTLHKLSHRQSVK